MISIDQKPISEPLESETLVSNTFVTMTSREMSSKKDVFLSTAHAFVAKHVLKADGKNVTYFLGAVEPDREDYMWLSEEYLGVLKKDVTSLAKVPFLDLTAEVFAGEGQTYAEMLRKMEEIDLQTLREKMEPIVVHCRKIAEKSPARKQIELSLSLVEDFFRFEDARFDQDTAIPNFDNNVNNNNNIASKMISDPMYIEEEEEFDAPVIAAATAEFVSVAPVSTPSPVGEGTTAISSAPATKLVNVEILVAPSNNTKDMFVTPLGTEFDIVPDTTHLHDHTAPLLPPPSNLVPVSSVPNPAQLSERQSSGVKTIGQMTPQTHVAFPPLSWTETEIRDLEEQEKEPQNVVDSVFRFIHSFQQPVLASTNNINNNNSKEEENHLRAVDHFNAVCSANFSQSDLQLTRRFWYDDDNDLQFSLIHVSNRFYFVAFYFMDCFIFDCPLCAQFYFKTCAVYQKAEGEETTEVNIDFLRVTSADDSALSFQHFLTVSPVVPYVVPRHHPTPAKGPAKVLEMKAKAKAMAKKSPRSYSSDESTTTTVTTNDFKKPMSGKKFNTSTSKNNNNNNNNNNNVKNNKKKQVSLSAQEEEETQDSEEDDENDKDDENDEDVSTESSDESDFEDVQEEKEEKLPSRKSPRTTTSTPSKSKRNTHPRSASTKQKPATNSSTKQKTNKQRRGNLTDNDIIEATMDVVEADARANKAVESITKLENNTKKRKTLNSSSTETSETTSIQPPAKKQRSTAAATSAITTTIVIDDDSSPISSSFSSPNSTDSMELSSVKAHNKKLNAQLKQLKAQQKETTERHKLELFQTSQKMEDVINNCKTLVERSESLKVACRTLAALLAKARAEK